MVVFQNDIEDAFMTPLAKAEHSIPNSTSFENRNEFWLPSRAFNDIYTQFFSLSDDDFEDVTGFTRTQYESRVTAVENQRPLSTKEFLARAKKVSRVKFENSLGDENEVSDYIIDPDFSHDYDAFQVAYLEAQLSRIDYLEEVRQEVIKSIKRQYKALGYVLKEIYQLVKRWEGHPIFMVLHEHIDLVSTRKKGAKFSFDRTKFSNRPHGHSPFLNYENYKTMPGRYRAT